MLRNCKADYFNYKFESHRENIRNTWNHLKHLSKVKQTRNPITMTKYKGNELLEVEQIAGDFNAYFSTVATDLDSKIPCNRNASPLDYLHTPMDKSFYLSPKTSVRWSL